METPAKSSILHPALPRAKSKEIETCETLRQQDDWLEKQSYAAGEVIRKSRSE